MRKQTNMSISPYMSMNQLAQQEHAHNTHTHRKRFLMKNEGIVSTEMVKIVNEIGWLLPMPKCPSFHFLLNYALREIESKGWSY